MLLVVCLLCHFDNETKNLVESFEVTNGRFDTVFRFDDAWP